MIFDPSCSGSARKSIQRWHVDQTSTRLRRIVWRSTPATMHLTPLEHAHLHQAPYTCPSTTSWWGIASHGDGYSHTRLYDIASPQGMIHFSHTFRAFHLIFHTDLCFAVLTCLQTPFVPPRRLIATVPENFLPPLPPSISHRTYH